MGIRRRLGDLEGRLRSLAPKAQSRARERMEEHLNRIATARRAGSFSEEERTEAENVRRAVERRLARDRGEVGS